MKTNAIISALCVVGIIGALCSNGEEQRSVVETRGDWPDATLLPVQKVVYWSNIPGMKWDWGTQVTNAPAFVTQSVTNGLASTNEVNLKYTKPAGGIPKSDLEVGVQTSLNYADVAIFRVWYPDGSVTSESQFTSGLKYDLDGNGNAVIKTFYNTKNAANDNSDKVGAVVIPPYIVDGNGVRHTVVGIGSGGGSSSSNPNLTSVTIPSTVTSIANAAFRQCTSLTSITIPDGVTSIEGRVFMYCSKLASVTIPDGVTSIGGNAFQNCSSFTGVTIPKGVTSIGAWAFNGCSGLEFVDFGDTAFSSIPTLGSQVFDNVPTTCKFIVPDSQYDTWKAASGWSTLVSQGYTFLRHSEWEYARRYELASSISTATNGLASKTYVDSHQWTWASISNKPSFATVATSGSYNDLSNKPSIPAASDFVSISGDTITGNLTFGNNSGIVIPDDDSDHRISISDYWDENTVYIKPTRKTDNASLASLKDIAAAYSASSAYVVGQLCIKDDELVKCTTAGTGSSAVFASATVEDVLTAMRTTINGLPTYDDVLLTPVFTEWSFSPATYSDGRVITMHEEDFGDVVEYSIYANGVASGADIQAESPTVTTITWGYPEWGGGGWGMGTELVATRTISSYQLGSQSDKLLQPSGNYALKSEIPSTNGFASKTYVDSHQWTWNSITNKPNVLTSESDPTVGWTNGTLYVHGDTINPVQYQQDGSVRTIRLIASGTYDGAELNTAGFVQGSDVKIPTSAGIYSAVFGWNATSTNQFAFVYSGRGENQYYSHGSGTFNIDPIGGASGFWIGETNLATYFDGKADVNHAHSNLVNGTTQVIANQNGTASIVGSEQEKWIYSSTEGTVDLRWSNSGGTAGYWSGSMQNGLHFRLVTDMNPLDAQYGRLDASVEFIRVEDYGDTNLLWKSPMRFTPNTPSPGIIRWSSQGLIIGAPASEYASSGYTVDGTPTEQDLTSMTVGYSGTTTFAMDTETGEMTGYFTLAGPISWNNVTSSHTGGKFSKTIATVDQLPTIPTNVSAFSNDANYVPASTATNIARQIIRNAVSGVNTNIQSAEDARATLTNLITILKNL